MLPHFASTAVIIKGVLLLPVFFRLASTIATPTIPSNLDSEEEALRKDYTYSDGYEYNKEFGYHDALGAGSDDVLSKRQLPKCTPERRLQRKAWHTLSRSEKTAYLNAEVCLMLKPSRDPARHIGSKSLYDDLMSAHNLAGDGVHFTGWFLPFHRLHISTHESLLRSECGYQGAQPYWDETLEAGRFTTDSNSVSNIFSLTIGFGGDGALDPANPEAAGCITNGPFTNYPLTVGPGTDNGRTSRCITRRIHNGWSTLSDQAQVDRCLSLSTFAEAWPCIEGGPHNGGHNGVGGLMSGRSAPGDPLFYLHHAFVDKIWAQWQSRDMAKRKRDVAGSPSGSFTTNPAGGRVETTLQDVLTMHGVVEDVKLWQVMDLGGDRLCAEYV